MKAAGPQASTARPSWQDDLAACFDNLERLFALHAMNEARAFDLLARARAEGVSWREMSNAIRALLESDGCTIQHIEMQVDQVETRFRPWLS